MKGNFSFRRSGEPDVIGDYEARVMFKKGGWRGLLSRARTVEVHRRNVFDYESVYDARDEAETAAFNRWMLASIGLRFIPESVKYKDVGEMNDEACSLGAEVIRNYMDTCEAQFERVSFGAAAEAVLGKLAREEMQGKKPAEYEQHYEMLQEMRLQRKLEDMENRNPSRSYLENVCGCADLVGRDPLTNQGIYRERGWTDPYATQVMPLVMRHKRLEGLARFGRSIRN